MAGHTPSALKALISKLRSLLSRVAGSTSDQERPSAAPEVLSSEPTQPAKNSPTKRTKKPRKPAATKPQPKPIVPACPHCKKPMVIKVARTGQNAGEFWGCAGYPKCRGIRPIFR
ncbi:topoisomerase DNA-binding C4 zinc finger domain-containing protein [Pseudomonas syringae]|uniref:topoisomerase DNA-binding C4 zinc finger domain-containing protein n=1 Tax=Pseudomonas syringae TaxID=317 RepID=UPI00073E3CFB|nr:topoisomerase DNA-binding C4 zinc finger domain-containing protein [Pseudomonas syringae]